VKRRPLEIGILLLAALVRLWALGGQSLWMDETFSHLFDTLPLDIAWQAIVVDAVHPPLYYLLLRPWLALAGGGEFALRFPSAMAGLLTVALLLRAGRDWLGEQAARWAAFLLALSPFHAWYSQEGRMYTLLGLLVLAVLAAFWWALCTRKRRAWAVLVALSALAYTTHYFALYLPLIEFIFLWAAFRRHHRVLARWAVVQGLAVLPLAGWLVALYTIGGGSFGIGWIPKPQPADLLRTLWSFGMAYDGRVTVSVVAGVLVWSGLLVLGVGGGRGGGEARLLLALALSLPPLVTFLLSMRRPTYVDRFFIGCLSPFLLLAGGGLARLPRAARWAAGLILVGICAWGIVRFHTDSLFAKEGWREAAAHIEMHEAVGDALALRQFQYVVPFDYYYQGVLKPVAVTLNQQTMPLEEVAAGHGRVWVVFRGRRDDLHHLAWSEPFDLARDEADPVVWEWIVDHPPKAVETFPGVSVMLFDLTAD
jgi:mannosyltransferase